ncbi:MAG: hypothetical protein H6809_04365 [Phycisphaeraceae bacterium]|nr:hypothetical protein [Phycisphaeraceae bacterium]
MHRIRLAALAVGVLAAGASAQTTQLAPSVFKVASGVDFALGHDFNFDYLYTWTDSSGTMTDERDPTLILVAGQTYTFMRVSSNHPFAITDDTLPIEGTNGSFERTTTDPMVIDNATLKPIEAFTASPAPTTDRIEWTPALADVGIYYNTCTVTGHAAMTGKIKVVAPCPADLTTGAIPGQPGFGVPDGVLTNNDFFYFLGEFAAGNIAVADLTTGAVPGQPGYGAPDTQITNDDFFYYLAIFGQGC